MKRYTADTNALLGYLVDVLPAAAENVSLDVLEKHYDRRSEEEKAEQRRGYLDEM
jgi:hypothetical protein